MEFRTAQGRERFDALARAAARVIVGLDFDGTLAPIVEDPTRAHIHPDGPRVLAALAEQVLAVAVITGRPARQVLALGGLEEVGDAFADAGKDLHVFGQYGNERWSSTRRRVVGPRPPHGLASFERELPRVLRRLDAADAFVEDKHLAVAVHTRRMSDPAEAFDRLLPALRELADRHGLAVEPGRAVIEVRGPGVHKGVAVQTLARELGGGGFLFAGDDLGDLQAFEAVRTLADAGLPTLLVCSSSDEESALLEHADVVVDGPAGVLALLAALTEAAAAQRAAAR